MGRVHTYFRMVFAVLLLNSVIILPEGKNFKMIPTDEFKTPELIDDVNRLCFKLSQHFGEGTLRGWHFAASLDEIRLLADMDPNDIVLVKAPPANCSIYGYETIIDKRQEEMIYLNEIADLSTVVDEEPLIETDEDTDDVINNLLNTEVVIKNVSCMNIFYSVVKYFVCCALILFTLYCFITQFLQNQRRLIRFHAKNDFDQFESYQKRFAHLIDYKNWTKPVWFIEFHLDTNSSLKNIPQIINLNTSNFMMEWTEFLLVVFVLFVVSYYLRQGLLRD